MGNAFENRRSVPIYIPKPKVTKPSSLTGIFRETSRRCHRRVELTEHKKRVNRASFRVWHRPFAPDKQET